MNLKNRYLRGDLPAFFKYLMKVYTEDGARLFLITRKNSHKLEEGILQLSTIKIISPMKSKHLTSLPRELVQPLSFVIFKTQLDTATKNLI